MRPLYILVDSTTNIVLGVTDEVEVILFVSESLMSSEIHVVRKDIFNAFYMNVREIIYLKYLPETSELGVSPSTEIGPIDIARTRTAFNRINATSVLLGYLRLSGKNLDSLSQEDRSSLSEITSHRHGNFVRRMSLRYKT